MKRAYVHKCRHCGCIKDGHCSILTQRGVRSCQWYEPGLCDNPQCLITEAARLEKPLPDLGKASILRERADNIRRNGG